jgi:hypothetical protein
MTDTDSARSPTASDLSLGEETLSPNGAQPGAPDRSGSVSFPELTLAHYEWRRAIAAGRLDTELEKAYCMKLDRFERDNGRIISAYWCLDVPSAVVLTERPRARVVRWLLRPKLCFHRVTDWATRGRPQIAAGLHRCDAIAVRSGEVLTGLRHRICLQLVMASASHLLSLADKKAEHRDPDTVLKQEEENLEDVWGYYKNAANGQAQMIYFAGMALFTVALCLLALPNAVADVVPNVDDRELFGALFAGAVGAVVSVVQRINSGRFSLEYDVGRPYPFFLGGLRPLMGGVFGLGIYFAVSSGLLELPIASEGTARFYALMVLAFVAGFSERWAKDTLARTSRVVPVEESDGDRDRVNRSPEPTA